MASSNQLPASASPAGPVQSGSAPPTHQGEVLQALLDKIRADGQPKQAAKQEPAGNAQPA
jgi:hypothetical protein